jgi:diguanylate cyclase (GGDEF)-like protein
MNALLADAWVWVSLAKLEMAMLFVGTFVAFDLLIRLGGRPRGDGWAWLAGAAFAFATTLWATQIQSVDHAGMPTAVTFHPWWVVAAWLAAAGVSLVAFACAARHGGSSGMALLGAALLAAGWVGLHLLFLNGLDLVNVIDASALPLAAAGMLAFVGGWFAFWLFGEVRVRARRHLVVCQSVSAAVMSATFVGAQALLMSSALHSPQTLYGGPDRIASSTLGVLATVGLAVLLGMLLLLSKVEAHWRSAFQRAKNELQRHARRDPLTELPNRDIFEGLLAQAVGRADVAQERLALLLIDLDGFKAINETQGHRAGDAVLREMASRLRSLAGPHTVARLGADEFLVLMPENPRVDDAAAEAHRLLGALREPLRIDGRDIELECSIGVAMYPQDGALSTLISHAGAAMSAAKSSGGASYAFFEARMVAGLREQTELLRDLRNALTKGELEMVYQPKIYAPTGEITGAEALIRWKHPKLGIISPVVFIPLAERFGLIGSLGNWVIEEVCRQIASWRDDGLRMRVAINLSVHQLRQPDLVERIATALRTHGVNPGLLTCEVTESVAMEDTEAAIRIFGELTQIGAKISIDDFGTGHSSLSYLRKLPASELKIDRSFVMDLETSEDARKVASAVINLAKALDLRVVAEGVETEGQNRVLRELGCDQLQGFLFGKPMSAKALALWSIGGVGPRSIQFRDSLFQDTQPPVVA